MNARLKRPQTGKPRPDAFTEQIAGLTRKHLHTRPSQRQPRRAHPEGQRISKTIADTPWAMRLGMFDAKAMPVLGPRLKEIPTHIAESLLNRRRTVVYADEVAQMVDDEVNAEGDRTPEDSAMRRCYESITTAHHLFPPTRETLIEWRCPEGCDFQAVAVAIDAYHTADQPDLEPRIKAAADAHWTRAMKTAQWDGDPCDEAEAEYRAALIDATHGLLHAHFVIARRNGKIVTIAEGMEILLGEDFSPITLMPEGEDARIPTTAATMVSDEKYPLPAMYMQPRSFSLEDACETDLRDITQDQINHLSSTYGQAILLSSTIALKTIELLACSNVDLVPAGNIPTARKGRALERAPGIRYHVLRVNRGGQQIKVYEKAETGRGMAMHRVRAHFRDYSQGKGLFGRYHKAKVFCPSFLRGSREHGVVVKDYDAHIEPQTDRSDR